MWGMENLVSAARKAFNLDHTAIGEIIGVHRSTVCRWELRPERLRGPAKKMLEDMLARKETDA